VLYRKIGSNHARRVGTYVTREDAEEGARFMNRQASRHQDLDKLEYFADANPRPHSQANR
jgi:hypothetical protein